MISPPINSAQVLAERQAEAGAAVFGGNAGVRLSELVEQGLLRFLADAHAGVGDGDLDQVAVPSLAPPQTQRDLAVVRELGGIADQVEQRLPHLGGIEAHLAQGLGAAVDDERVGVLGGQRPAGDLHLVDELVEVEIVEEEVHLAGLDLGDVEDVVDHREQVLAGSADLLQIADLLAAAVELGVLEQDLAVADDGVERSAQLVAHLGQELGLGAVGALGLVLGVGQLLASVAWWRSISRSSSDWESTIWA